MSNTKSDNLHKLIKSMSKPEKRYFKVFSSRHIIGDENNYQVLFDAIDKQEVYDEEKLMKKFKGQEFTHRFSIAKNRLYNNILKSLDAFHSNSSVEAQLHRQVHSAEILYHKALYDQSLKLLNSAKKVAEKHELFSVVSEIIQWEKRIAEKDQYESYQSEDELIALTKEQGEVLSKLALQNELWMLKSRLFFQLYRQGKARSESDMQGFKTIVDEAARKIGGENISVDSQYMINHIYSAYHFSSAQYELCYPFLTQNLQLIDQNPHLFDEEPGIYVSVLSNAIYVGMRLGKWKEAFAYLESLRALPTVFEHHMNEDLSMRLFSLGKSTELTLYAQSGEFEKGLELLPEITEGLKRYDENISSVRKAHFYFNGAVILFGMEQYHESLKWINKLLNNVDIDKTKDIHCIAQILNLVIHLELGNTELLPYTLRSTQRFLETRHKVFRFENVMLEFINEMLKKRQSKTIDELYVDLLDQLQELRNDEHEKIVFEYFDFLAWTKSKTNGKTYRELVAA